jgi:hypothetical protein
MLTTSPQIIDASTGGAGISLVSAENEQRLDTASATET